MKADYASAAKALAKMEPPVTLAKIEGEKAKDIAEEYEVKGFPTMKWFVEGEGQDVAMKERDSKNIIKWCQRRSGDPAPVRFVNHHLAPLLSSRLEWLDP